MFKTLALLFFISIASVTGNTNNFGIQQKFIKYESVPTKSGNVGLDWCPDCVSTMDQLVSTVLDIILQGGVIDSCGELCNLVADKTGSGLLGFICTMGCDFLGLEAFVNLMQEADIDPIYYCEKMNICPVNDNGDLTFAAFSVLPARAQTESTINVNMALKTVNGTGTGELVLIIHTVDKIPLSGSFLYEAKKPGTYTERFSIDTTPDPECDPSVQQCEQWLEGTYNVSVMVCNGQCGSHHPHTSVYCIADGSFTLYE